MIIVQIIMWLAFGAVSLVCIAYLFNVFGKVEEHKKSSVKYMLSGSCNCSSWCATCIRYTPSASGCKACGEGVSPTGHGEGACARGGAAPLSPPRILHSHP